MFGRFPYLRQDDHSDCGAAALAMVALYHRLSGGLQRLRDLAGTDRAGTNMRGLLTAAQAIGFAARVVKGPYEALVEVPLPAIAHLINDEGLGHFVVLYRAGRRSVRIADPAQGPCRQGKEEFCSSWTGHLLLLTPQASVGSISAGRPATPWQRFLGLLSQQKGLLVESLLCALMMTLLAITTSYFVQHLVDSVLSGGEAHLLNAVGIGMLLVMAFRAIFGLLRHYLLAWLARRVDLGLISAYMRHVLALPVSFFQTRQVGEIISRVNDAEKVRDAISGTALAALVDGVMVMVALSALWVYDLRLAAVATAFMPLLIGAVMVHHRPMKRTSRVAMEQSARWSSHVVEDISAAETVKGFNLQQARAARAENRLLGVVQSTFSLQKLSICVGTVGVFVTGSAGIVVLWYGGHRVISGALSIGQLMFFYTLLNYLLEPLGRLASVNLGLQEALVAIDRLYQVMDLPVEDEGRIHQAPARRMKQEIRFQDVNFRYGCRNEVLQEINLTIPTGSTVAIVGESGSGKSTLLKLLLRYHDPTSGQILIDDMNLRDLDVHTLRSQVSLVSQEPFMFSGTLRENIALAAPQANLEQIAVVARAAGLEEFVARLPDRYDTVIGERGTNLSGGQRQRVAIARALLNKPEVLLFDEATSHLDTATEQAIQRSLSDILSGKTVVLVAHRLSTVKQAERIYVMDQGRIVEDGTHQKLIAEQGRYAALWQAQTENDRGVVRPINGHANGAHQPIPWTHTVKDLPCKTT